MGKLIKVLVLSIFSYAIESKDLASGPKEVVLKPQMRSESNTSPLYTIPTDDLIRYFSNLVLFDTKEEFDKLPYIFGFDMDRDLGGAGDTAFAVGIKPEDEASSFTLVAVPQAYVDPDTGADIGYKVDVIGEAEVVNFGDPTTTLFVTKMSQSITPGVKLIPRIGLDLPSAIEVKNPDKPLSGYVLETENKSVGSGSYSVVTLNIGRKDGLLLGNVLDLVELPRAMLDPYTNEKIKMPTVKFGEVIVYKVSDKISLAVIAHASRPVLPKDMVLAE